MEKVFEFVRVRAGSSLIKVKKVSRDQLAVSEIERMVSQARLFRETGGTYQDRKLVFFADGVDRTCFRFVQLDENWRIVWDMPECLNSAAAIVHVLAESGTTGSFRLHNVGSDQEMLAYPQADSLCRVRFVVDRDSLADRFRDIEESGPFRKTWFGNLSNPYLFVLTENADPGSVTQEITDYCRFLEARGLGGTCSRKILVFSPTSDKWRFRAFCRFRGDLHRSIPGTGAMWLGALLTFKGFGLSGTESRYAIEHPRGVMETRNNLDEGDGGCEWWLECTTRTGGTERFL